MTGGNITRRVVTTTDASLSIRDRNIVETVASLGLASGEQLRQLHFRDHDSVRSSRRTAQQALRSLAEKNVLARLRRRVGGVRSGSAGFIYSLGPVGQRLARNWRGEAKTRTRRAHEPGDAFVSHRLACTQLFVDLKAAEATDGLLLDQYLGEPECWRQRIGPFGRPLVLKPDAFVRLDVGTRTLHWFVEIDLATESQRVISRKGLAYVEHFRSGAEPDVMPRVLWLVPDEHRLELVRRTLRQLPEPSEQLHLVAVASDAIKSMKGEHQ